MLLRWGLCLVVFQPTFFVLSLNPQLRVCTYAYCSRNGANNFLEAAQSLCTGTDVKVASSDCMSICKGIVVASEMFPAKTRSLAGIDNGNEILAIKRVAAVLSEAGVDTSGMQNVLIGKLEGDKALRTADFTSAIDIFTGVIDSEPAAAVRRSQSEAANHLDVKPPVFRLSGQAAQIEAERITPANVRWLFESLLGRCCSRLAADSNVDGALADAREAVYLCPLAGRGWYRLKDAAEAAGDAEAIAEAVAKLEDLGYSLEPGLEGPKLTKAESQALAQKREQDQQLMTNLEVAATRSGGIWLALAVALKAAEMAQLEVEFSTPEAIAARELQATTAALVADLTAGSKVAELKPGKRDEVLRSFRFGNRGKRDGLLEIHSKYISVIGSALMCAKAIGVEEKLLEEARLKLEELEETQSMMQEADK